MTREEKKSTLFWNNLSLDQKFKRTCQLGVVFGFFLLLYIFNPAYRMQFGEWGAYFFIMGSIIGIVQLTLIYKKMKR